MELQNPLAPEGDADDDKDVDITDFNFRVSTFADGDCGTSAVPERSIGIMLLLGINWSCQFAPVSCLVPAVVLKPSTVEDQLNAEKGHFCSCPGILTLLLNQKETR